MLNRWMNTLAPKLPQVDLANLQVSKSLLSGAVGIEQLSPEERAKLN